MLHEGILYDTKIANFKICLLCQYACNQIKRLMVIGQLCTPKLYLNFSWTDFYRAMHFSAKRGIAIACRLSVRPSVCDVGEL